MFSKNNSLKNVKLVPFIFIYKFVKKTIKKKLNSKFLSFLCRNKTYLSIYYTISIELIKSF